MIKNPLHRKARRMTAIHQALDPQHPEHYLHESTWHQAIRSRYAVDLWLATISPQGSRRHLEIRTEGSSRVIVALIVTPTRIRRIGEPNTPPSARCYTAVSEHVDLAYIQAAAWCESEEGRAA